MKSLKNANKADDPTANFTINTICISLINNGEEIELYPIPFGHVLHTNEKEEKWADGGAAFYPDPTGHGEAYYVPSWRAYLMAKYKVLFPTKALIHLNDINAI